jgi:hypothetical protein
MWLVGPNEQSEQEKQMRVAKEFKILASPKLREYAQKALDIQDACNPRAVCHFLRQLISELSDDQVVDGEDRGPDIGLQNPVTLAVLNKLNDLAGLEQTRCECFTACYDLAEGTDVNWVINVLQ